MKKFFFFIILICIGATTHSQSVAYQWTDPAEDHRFIIEGQGWKQDELESPYDRLPVRAKANVRDAVWNLSRSSAGIYVTFSTDAPKIQIRYQVIGSLQMPHMPATGVSGLDLYVESSSENPVWYAGSYHFGDTITYSYTDLHSRYGSGEKPHTYKVYLPLYNGVKWMEIGIPEENNFYTADPAEKKPVVVYGTSIAQGACASRPGMAWTNIVQRNLNRPIINLGFSGNGRLEPEVMNLINEIDASVFILDCLPNLINEEKYPEKELKNRIRESVRILKSKYPRTPIILTDHAGYPNERLSEKAYSGVNNANRWQHEIVEQLKKEEVKDLHLLTKSEIDMCMDCTVDYVHQTDLGMEYYAKAYLRILNQILHGAP